MKAKVAAVLALALLWVAGPHTQVANAAAAANTWTCSTGDNASGCSAATIAPMPTPRSGAVLVESTFDNRLYAIDGKTGAATYTGVNQSYSPSTNSWATSASDGIARADAGSGLATVLGTAYIYSAGGYNGSYQARAAYFEPANGSWGTVADDPTPRSNMGGVAGSDGDVYMMGGQSGSGYLSTVEAYNPLGSAWYCSTQVTGCTSTSTPPVAMPTARAGFGIVSSSSGVIYTIGGQTAASNYTNVVEAYNPSTRTWACSAGDAAVRCSSTSLAPEPTARAAGAAIAANGLIYVVGGSNASTLSTVEAYNPSTNSWICSSGDSSSGCTQTVLSPLPTARSDASVGFGSDGQLYVVGGSYLSTVEAYQPPTLPGSPTGMSASPGDSMARIAWTAPSNTGGIPLSGYSITCTPSCGTVVVSGTATSGTVSGLTNGVAYTFTVYANNFVGSGPSATTSGSITPSCNPGPPTISGGAPGNFSATLGGSDQTTATSLASYTASYSGCSGFNVTMQATRMQNSGGDQLPAGSLVMPPPTVSSCQSFCGSGSKSLSPSVCMRANTALDGGAAITVASAPAETGEGSYLFSPGAISGGNLQLSIPSYAYATTYSSTVTISIVQGPAGSC